MRKLFLSVIILGLLSIIVTGCTNNNQTEGPTTSNSQVQPITVDQLNKQLNAGTDQNTLLVDLREPILYKKGHIKDAILIPFADFEKQYTQLDKNKKIIFICHTGPMGEVTGQFLLSKGYTQIYNLDGGMEGWDKNIH